MVDAFINDRKAKLLIDTGASKTVFDIIKIKDFLDDTGMELNDKLSAGIGTNSLESHTAVIKSFRIGEFIIENYKAVIIDMCNVTQSYATLNLPQIDGVLGGDLLFQQKAVIDYEKSTLTLETNAG